MRANEFLEHLEFTLGLTSSEMKTKDKLEHIEALFADMERLETPQEIIKENTPECLQEFLLELIDSFREARILGKNSVQISCLSSSHFSNVEHALNEFCYPFLR